MVYKTIKSEQKYSGKVFTVFSDEVEYPNGHLAHLDLVKYKNAVVILPIDEDGNVYFVKQYRHASGDLLLELPAGTIEPGEDPLECASRELQEEIDMAAGEMLPLSGFFMAPGSSTEYIYAFLATGLYPSSLPEDEDELIEVVKFPLSKVMEMAYAGEIHDAKSISALFLSLPRLKS
ncbi:MAG: NUDIX hydrolase [Anaerolineales bacterium]|nr:NUDIX hydrolase [Anaerolineales bacterium]